MKLTFSFVFFIFSIASFSQIYSGPESVEFDSGRNRWLVANTSSHQIIARDSVGTLSVFATGIGSGPYGIEIVGDTIFCCSGASIKGFLLSSGTQVFNLNVGATFLNGITHDNSGNLIVTDFTAKTIYKISIAAQTYAIVASGLSQSPNGIIFDANNNRCVLVNWGTNAPIKAIDLTTFAVSNVINTTLSNCDGIARDGQGRYYVSNWGSQSVVRYDSSFITPPITVATSLSSPADICYDPIHDILAIPNSGNNTVIFVDFSTVGVKEIENNYDVSVFPNPANEKLFFHSAFNEIESISVFNSNAQEIQLKIISIENGDVQVDVSTLTRGNYFYRVIGKNGNEKKGKFLKEE